MPLPLQLARKLRDECARHRRLRSSHVGYHKNEIFWIPLDGIDNQVCPMMSECSVYAIYGSARSNPGKVLEQGQAEHNGNGPQLTDCKWTHLLVGVDDIVEALHF